MDWGEMRQVGDATKPRMLFNSTLSGVLDDESGKRSRLAVEEFFGRRDVTGVAQVRGCGALLGFQAIVPNRSESWNELRQMDLTAKVAAVKDAEFRAKLVDEAKQSNSRWPDPK